MSEEHPFAQYIRILGKGRNGSRALSPDEAYAAMSMIIEGRIEPVQLGAFLMLLRVKEETAEEVAAFVSAIRDHLQVPCEGVTVDLDWSTYAGKKRQLPWYLLATLLMAENGITIFMHGAAGHTAGRIYAKDVLPMLGVPMATHFEEAKRHLTRLRFAYMDLEHLSPQLQAIIGLRPLLGLRSPVHTIARMLNPFNAPAMMQGIFHPGYRPTHQLAAQLLEQPHMAVIKGEGGEIERNPDVACLVQSVHNGELSDEEWPPMFEKRHVRSDEMDLKRLLRVWSGDEEEEYGVAAVVGTIAIALHMMGRAKDRHTAEAQAWAFWNHRDRNKFR